MASCWLNQHNTNRGEKGNDESPKPCDTARSPLPLFCPTQLRLISKASDKNWFILEAPSSAPLMNNCDCMHLLFSCFPILTTIVDEEDIPQPRLVQRWSTWLGHCHIEPKSNQIIPYRLSRTPIHPSSFCSVYFSPCLNFICYDLNSLSFLSWELAGVPPWTLVESFSEL